MKRTYILFGATTIISLAILNLLSFKFSAVLFAVSIPLSLILFLFRKKSKSVSSAFICSLALMIASSSFCTKTAADYMPVISLCSEETKTVSGTLYEYEKSYNKHYYTIKNAVINGKETDVTIRVCCAAYQKAEIDDLLTFTSATVYELGKSSSNSAAYKANNIYIGAYTTDYFTVTKAEKHTVNYYLNEIREHINASMSLAGNDTVSSLAVALLTGETSGINPDILQNFRHSGIAHLFAVSGFHLSLWTAVISMAFDNIFKKKKYLSPILSILFVLFFMTLTGFSKSVVRAGIMMLVMLTGKLISRHSDSLNSLFLAVSLILIINPFAVMSISLQLSFLATLGIIVFSKPINEFAKNINEKLKYKSIAKILSIACTIFIISITASLFTLPVCAISLNSFSLWSPVTNILCLSAAQLMMILSAVATLLSPVAAISKPLMIGVTMIAKYILIITQKIAQLKYAVVDTSSVFAKIIFLAATVIIFIFIFISAKSHKRLKITLFASYISVIIISCIILTVQTHSVKITTADVGNGMSVVLNIKGKNIIIGCGGSAYKEYRFTDAADTNTMQYDLLIIPRDTQTESGYMYQVLYRYNIDRCVCFDADIPDYAKARFPENTVFIDNYALKLDENCNLLYINNDDFTGVRIESEDFTCTIVFRPTSDFSSVDEKWSEGSLLITRQALPDIDLSGFDNVIISSSLKKTYAGNKIYSTAQSGQITYRFYPFFFTTISEEKNDFK